MALFPKSYQKMGDSSGPSMASRMRGARGGISIRLALSYASDWAVLLLCVAVSAVLGHINPAKRPFSLVNPDISFPFTEHELVPTYLLLILVAGVPIVVIPLVCLFLVPGPTVSKDTPKSLIWRRKLWELHIGWLGLALSLVAAWTFTESMKNIFGKPRPDLIARCKPDMTNITKYIVGGMEWDSMHGQLVSADICTQTDRSTLNDGFRSYPSGHSSSSAAGLIYLALFLASKFSVTFPYVMPSAASAAGAAGHSAFPSRTHSGGVDPYEPTRALNPSPYGKGMDDELQQNIRIQSLRKQAAAPPLYLLVLTILPFGLAVFIASSRWYDFRHHGFDILFGFLMGTATAIYSFFYYHLPIQVGAGWAWGPRSDERAFWAGVGRLGFVDDEDEEIARQSATGRQDIGLTATTEYPSMTSGVLTQRPVPAHQQDHYDDARERPSFQDVELQRMSPALSDERDHHPHRPPPHA